MAQPRIHYYQANADALCTTNLAEETIGTVKTNSECTDILGFYLSNADTTGLTAAQAEQVKFIIKPASIAPEDLEVMGGTALGGGKATHNAAYWTHPKWLPFSPTGGLSLKNRNIVGKIDSVLPEPTSEQWASITMVYADGAYPADVLQNVGAVRTRTRWSGTAYEHDNGASTSDPFPVTITVPSWVKEITAMSTTVAYMAVPSAAEHFGGYLEVTSTAGNIEPLEVPLPTGTACTGTLPEGAVRCDEFVCPQWIPLPDADVTFSFRTHIQQVLSGKAQIAVTLYGR